MKIYQSQIEEKLNASEVIRLEPDDIGIWVLPDGVTDAEFAIIKQEFEEYFAKTSRKFTLLRNGDCKFRVMRPSSEPESEPDFTKEIDVLAFFYHKLNACGCFDFEEMIPTIRQALEWLGADMDSRAKYEELYGGDIGIFYTIMGLLDNARLSEHSTSIRHAWLSPKGKQLLDALRFMNPEDIENAEGDAYNGFYYGI